MRNSTSGFFGNLIYANISPKISIDIFDCDIAHLRGFGGSLYISMGYGNKCLNRVYNTKVDDAEGHGVLSFALSKGQITYHVNGTYTNLNPTILFLLWMSDEENPNELYLHNVTIDTVNGSPIAPCII